ncbi:hypothetical protein RJZ56_006485 [Blastomyces dermatitidis]|uniref:Uncharacterized protein n=3 Tax=Blastomyces TaxID=229219 RepID=A0A179UZC0_BLAGS|nr:uncharacterized protein BDBG_07793 [Blastomyces gilchristii SLH14081]XP_045276877.1 uncharacterized protein BDCG_05197 [Blastomyces dermatitidis ER-3]EGE83705.1 hypothetical protein BDDG_06650 [Blastomyces dermatitidis ATCC 18188]EQL28855.1 hypothetical protein BDFG_08440 [Blastomyces dermatitidis ATCC 26199]EEQ90077.1 hypothetical protein BDCG_05197 [Blastomyces dermatitidis ER-3]OAT12457.1 hypothetical protein BDBG_07793 [Blastomyces gilchristii SLH14081]
MPPQTFRFNSTMRNTNVQLQDEKAAPVVSAGIFDPPTNPVFIAPQRKTQRPSIRPLQTTPRRNPPKGNAEMRSSSSTRPEVSVPLHVSNLLEATAIPVPRTWAGRKQRRLLDYNNAEYLGGLFAEGIAGNESGRMVRASRKSSLHVLLSPPNELADDESNLPAGSETPDSVESLSLDSVPSLDNDDDVPTPFSDPATPYFPTQRLPFVRKQRLFSPCEACPQDHPLLSSSIPDNHIHIDETPTKLPAYGSNSFRSLPKLGATVKSNLTASLRALRSAAQSVSNFTAPSVRSEDFLTRSFFSFSPELTDDKHPVPMKNPPSPALRRYLNPLTISAADIHIYSESPRGTPVQPLRCTASIQMQTYSSPVVNKVRRNRPFLNPTGADGSHAENSDEYNDSDYQDEEGEEDPPQSPAHRQREPRENGDFLRMVVLEMNMRRRGKLRSDIPGRAKVWLPPRKTVVSSSPSSSAVTVYMSAGGGGGGGCAGCKIPRRWIAVSADELC